MSSRIYEIALRARRDGRDRTDPRTLVPQERCDDSRDRNHRSWRRTRRRDDHRSTRFTRGTISRFDRRRCVSWKRGFIGASFHDQHCRNDRLRIFWRANVRKFLVPCRNPDRECVRRVETDRCRPQCACGCGNVAHLRCVRDRSDPNRAPAMLARTSTRGRSRTRLHRKRR